MIVLVGMGQEFCKHHRRPNSDLTFLGSTIWAIFSKDLIFYPAWVPQRAGQLVQVWQQIVFTLGIVNICLVGSMLLPLVFWPAASARYVLCVHVSWLPNKSRNHPVPHKFQCYQPIIPAAPQSSTDKPLKYFGAVFCCLLWKLKLLA